MAMEIHTAVSEAPWRLFSVDSNTDYQEDFTRLLSSPITSYEVKKVDSKTLAVKHHLMYKERFKATKEKYETESQVFDELCQSIREEISQRELDRKRLSDLEDDSRTRILNLHSRLCILEVERQADRDALLEWETKSRIAQGVNDYYVFFDPSNSIPEDAYKLLKAEGCGYLPHLLSAWAVFCGREPAKRFSINREEEEAYTGRAQALLTKQLDDSVESVWDSIPSCDRNIMISMFLSRPALRNLVVHIKPTIAEAKRIIDSDPRFVLDEIYRATEYLPSLIDKCSEKLFDVAGRSN